MQTNYDVIEIMFFVVTVVVMVLLINHDWYSDNGKTFGFATKSRKKVLLLTNSV
jgi:hypothetical protein